MTQDALPADPAAATTSSEDVDSDTLTIPGWARRRGAGRGRGRGLPDVRPLAVRRLRPRRPDRRRLEVQAIQDRFPESVAVR